MKSVTVTLWLRVENSSKFVRGKARARRDIEAHLERYYAMKRLGDWTYQPTVEYDDTGAEGQSLDDEMYGLVVDMANIAEIRHCFIETDLREHDTDRYW